MPASHESEVGFEKAQPAGLGLQVIPPTATPGGKSYAEWSMDWWRWLWAAPIPTGKMLFIDLAGLFASTAQGDGETEAEL